jgi:hypothetical protein
VTEFYLQKRQKIMETIARSPMAFLLSSSMKQRGVNDLTPREIAGEILRFVTSE